MLPEIIVSEKKPTVIKKKKQCDLGIYMLSTTSCLKK